MRLDNKKCRYISAAQMQPGHVLLPRAQREEPEITLFVDSQLWKWGQKGGGAEKRKNAGERSRVNAPHRVVFYLSCVFLWHDPKKPAQIPADYICLSSATNLSSLWLQQTTASTPPLFTPRLQVWPDFGWLKNFWLSMFHKEKKMMESLWQHVFTGRSSN